MKTEHKFLVETLNDSNLTVFLQPKSTFPPTNHHVSVNHHLEDGIIFFASLLFLLFWQSSRVLDWLYLQEVDPLLENLDEVRRTSLADLQDLGYQVDDFLVD